MVVSICFRFKWLSPYKDGLCLTFNSRDDLKTIVITANEGVVSNRKYTWQLADQFVAENLKRLNYLSPFVDFGKSV